jgi:hypothetical protein
MDAKTWMPSTRLRQGFDEATSGRLAEALAKAARPGMTRIDLMCHVMGLS